MQHILGLNSFQDCETLIKRAFDEFFGAHPHFTGDQITFVRMVRTVVLRRMHIFRAEWNESPFSYFGVNPAERLFQLRELDKNRQFANHQVL